MGGFSLWHILIFAVIVLLLPSSAPEIAETLRMVLGWAWTYVIVAELIGASSGIGHMITLASNYGQTDVIVVGLVVYALLGVTADSAVRLIERKALSWRRTLAS